MSTQTDNAGASKPQPTHAPQPVKEYKGLKKLRADNKGELMAACPNCNCARYSPCDCPKKS